MFQRETWRKFDYWLFGAVIFLIIFGIAMISSAIAGNEDLANQPQRQSVFALIAVGIIMVFALIDYHYWSSLSPFIYAFTVFALILNYFIGGARFGAARWIEVGLISIQPAELSKSLVIILLADFFYKQKDNPRNWIWVAKSLALTGSIVIWILLQPNLSNSIVIFVLWFALLWASGLPIKFIGIMIGSVLTLGLAAFPFLEPYQQGRIVSFIFPDTTARYGNTYNVQQALISIGSGGFLGQGYGHSTQVQLRFLQVRHTDYIFSAMASEFGFVGTILVISLLVFVIFRCFRAARLASDMFGSLIAYGFAILMFFQMAVNIGVNLNVIPVTGLTLPFISSGGSSLVSLAIGIGLVESVISHRKATG
jgi:rod shape determining protein RodA